MNYSYPVDEVSVSHRLGSPPKTGQDKRAIIAKFCRRDIKMDILKSTKNVKPANLFINESLTPICRTIHFILRKARKKYPNIISGISTYD